MREAALGVRDSLGFVGASVGWAWGSVGWGVRRRWVTLIETCVGWRRKRCVWGEGGGWRDWDMCVVCVWGSVGQCWVSVRQRWVAWSRQRCVLGGGSGSTATQVRLSRSLMLLLIEMQSGRVFPQSHHFSHFLSFSLSSWGCSAKACRERKVDKGRAMNSYKGNRIIIRIHLLFSERRNF